MVHLPRLGTDLAAQVSLWSCNYWDPQAQILPLERQLGQVLQIRSNINETNLSPSTVTIVKRSVLPIHSRVVRRSANFANALTSLNVIQIDALLQSGVDHPHLRGNTWYYSSHSESVSKRDLFQTLASPTSVQQHHLFLIRLSH